jgi:hypothetical protein
MPICSGVALHFPVVVSQFQILHKPFQEPPTEDKLMLLSRALYLNMDRVTISIGFRLVLSMLVELLTSCILPYYGIFSFGLKQWVFLRLV